MDTAIPNSTFASDTAELLAMEFEEWLRILITSHGVAPRAFTGITRKGQQVIVILNDIPWTRPAHVQRRAFIHWLCQKENIAAYAFASMMGREDGSREVHIVADDGIDIVDAVLPIVELADGNTSYGVTTVHRWKSGEHWYPYAGLMSPDSISETDSEFGDEAFFARVWGEMRPKAFWRARTPFAAGSRESPK